MDDQREDPHRFNVVVSNASKFYGSSSSCNNLVFRRVNLTVPPGTVYGLLGPSGCGKTTLLRCILGRLHLDQGSVTVFGHRPGTAASGVPGPNVGYMPQDTCIPDTLTIGECWAYYGTLAGLTEEKIACAIKYFIKLLNLPPANTVNGRLSGGELRRVAFATALIHEPKLLILDEPTVGIDCLTKKNMWEHLLKLAAENHTSIILTTHYIEEARAAHKVGLMQGGTLAIEDSTETLLQRFGCSALEEVFLKICQDSSSLISAQVIEKNNEDSLGVVIPDLEKKSWCDLFDGSCTRSIAVKAVTRKNFIHLCRFPGIILFAVLLPCLQTSMSILSYGTSFNRQHIALVNEDLGPMGAQYLTYLDKDILNLEFFSSPENALKALHSGDVCGLIGIQQNFSNAYVERMQASPMVKRDILNAATVNVLLDNTYFEIGGLLRMNFLISFGKFLHSTYADLGFNSKVVQPVIMFDGEVIEFLSQPDSTVSCISIMVMAAFFAPLAMAIINLYVERNCGYLERSIIAGLKPGELILGLMVTMMTIVFVQVNVIMIISYLMLFREFSLGGFCSVFSVLYFHGICGIAFGMLMSMCFSNSYALVCVTAAMVIFSGSITGGCFPLNSAPVVYRYIILGLPMAFPVKAISAVHFKAVLSNAAVMSSLACSFSWTAVCLLVSFAILKRNH